MAPLSEWPWLYEPRELAGDRREGEWSLFMLGEGGCAVVESEGGASTRRSVSERDNRRAKDGTEATFSGRRPTCTGVDRN